MSLPFPDTRWSLVASVGDGSTPAGRLVGLYADAVARYLRVRFPDQPGHAVDDAVQEVLVWLLEHPGILGRAEPGPGSRFRHWLMAVCQRAARNAFRRQDRGGPPIDADAAAADQPVDAGMDRAWAESVLQGAWRDLEGRIRAGHLDPEAMAAVEDHLVRGQTIRAIAAARGVGLGTAHRRVQAGLEALRACVRERLGAAGDAGDPDAVFRILGEALGA
ncbi:MAG: Sigma-70 region 2 [Planctomycetota bacterium]|jgi:DNA-directed RNA polymerase specialized sigma24 family protein